MYLNGLRMTHRQTRIIRTQKNSLRLVCEEDYGKIIQMLSIAQTCSNEKPPANS